MRLLNPSKAINIPLLTLLSATLALSAPTAVARAAAAAAPWPTDDTTLAVIDKYARYAAAAYCEKLNDNSANNKVCTNSAPGHCGDLADAVTVHQFSSSNTVAGNVAVSKAKKEIVVAIRGTADPKDVLTDLRANLKDPKKLFAQMEKLSQAVGAVPPAASPGDTDPLLPLCTKCRVHAGFWDAFRGIKDTLSQVIKQQRSQHPGYQVVITGHSLGGAVASIVACYLRKSGIHVNAYTFGSPRIGDPAFATFISAQGNGTTTRVTNAHDPVTVVPGVTFFGYAHTTPEYWFPKRRQEPKNVKLCEGVQNLLCSGQFFINPSHFGDHSSLEYSRGFDACPGKNLEGQMSHGFTEGDVEDWKNQGFVDDMDQIKAMGA